jgi:Subtilase family
MPVVRNGVEAYQGDQLVAEQEHAGLVTQELRRLGIAASVLDSDDRLSLTLLSLSGVETAAGLLRSDGNPATTGDPAGTGDLDLVLFTIRQRMRQEHDGWVATVGKNRIVGQVQGSPYIKGGIGVPDPAAPLVIPRPARLTGARVAVLDTALFAHPDLIGRFIGDSVTGFGGPPRSTPPLSTQGHATFIAGLIAQRAPAAQLAVQTVLDSGGQNASSWDVATAIAGILGTGTDVLNLSLGCATADREPPLCLRRAVELLTPSMVVVAAAGNNGMPDEQAAAAGLTPVTPVYPAAMDGVIAVGAYDSAAGTGEPAPFSPAAPWVDLLAPGVRVRSTFLPGQVQLVSRDPDGSLADAGTADFGQPGYADWDGTSFAAASVTGAIAAMMRPGRVSAYDALETLSHPGGRAGAGSDILPCGSV